MHKQHPHIIALILPALFFIANPLRARVVSIQNDQDFKRQVLQDNSAALVEFSASWCNVCNNVKKPFEEVAQEQEFAHVTFARVDIDNMRDLSKKHEVMGVPTFVYVENGSKKNQTIGVSNMESFKDDLRNNLRHTFKVAQAPAKPRAADVFEMPTTEPEIAPEASAHACSMHHEEEKHMAGACAMADEHMEGPCAAKHKMEGACGMKNHHDDMHGPCAHGGFLARLIAMIKMLLQKAIELVMWIPRKVMEMVGY